MCVFRVRRETRGSLCAREDREGYFDHKVKPRDKEQNVLLVFQNIAAVECASRNICWFILRFKSVLQLSGLFGQGKP